MKIKQYIGKTINGFQIVDTYARVTENGKTVRKVLLKCEDCGRMFERGSSVDFEHIKCKCMCADYGKEPRQYHMVEYNGKSYRLTDLCRENGISSGTFRSRIASGLSVDEALCHEFESTCIICGKRFTDTRPHKKYCSSTCRNRSSKGKGPYKQPHIATCQYCGATFETLRDDAISCSQTCSFGLDRRARADRFRELKRKGEYDYSITKEGVYERDGGICQRCGKLITYDVDCNDDNYPTTDHIIPLSKGGTHTWDNVQLLCRRCNVMKKAN